MVRKGIPPPLGVGGGCLAKVSEIRNFVSEISEIRNFGSEISAAGDFFSKIRNFSIFRKGFNIEIRCDLLQIH